MPFGMNWLDFGIMIIVVGVVLGIFYRALKEPIDLVVGWVGGLLRSGVDKLSTTGDEGPTVIRYG